MKKLVLATKNKDKIIEINNLLKNTAIQLTEVQGDFNPVESGNSFEENAYIKAYEAAKQSGLPSLADDSGLVIDALGGMPGIHSARYAENTQKRIDRVLQELKNVKPEKRTARFICCMVIVTPSGETLHSCTGICEGIILEEQKGVYGFGYDPIFLLPKFNKTMAELTLEQKNNYSHRSKALKCMIEWLKSNNLFSY
ncbi:MAG: RdgB/HAM1 family non-canonical purine NTP pyrophosphatase [Candidatus Gastranaerophilales bacterium]|nr:RdgB/HAM1 family non-canonical purine NTP pyrophosphatase [Candidatus Gastranaerophilales bacterium]